MFPFKRVNPIGFIRVEQITDYRNHFVIPIIRDLL